MCYFGTFSLISSICLWCWCLRSYFEPILLVQSQHLPHSVISEQDHRLDLAQFSSGEKWRRSPHWPPNWLCLESEDLNGKKKNMSDGACSKEGSWPRLNEKLAASSSRNEMKIEDYNPSTTGCYTTGLS